MCNQLLLYSVEVHRETYSLLAPSPFSCYPYTRRSSMKSDLFLPFLCTNFQICDLKKPRKPGEAQDLNRKAMKIFSNGVVGRSKE